jgi:hypothetical protein
MRVAVDRARWGEIGEAYVQQWTVVICRGKKIKQCLRRIGPARANAQAVDMALSLDSYAEPKFVATICVSGLPREDV